MVILPLLWGLLYSLYEWVLGAEPPAPEKPGTEATDEAEATSSKTNAKDVGRDKSEEPTDKATRE